MGESLYMEAIIKALEASALPLDYDSLSNRTGLELEDVKSQVKELWESGRVTLSVTISRNGSPIYVKLI